MTNFPSSSAARIGVNSPTQLYTSLTKSLLTENPGLKNIEARLHRDSARLSDIGKLALSLDRFRVSASRLSGDKLDAALSVGGNSVTARMSDAKLAEKTHTVEVRRLAQGQQLATPALPDGAVPLGNGSPAHIQVEVGTGSGGASTTIRIERGNNTLDGIAEAMRSAGLDAKVVRQATGYSLTLTGPAGAANSLKISVAGDPVLQGLLSYGPGVKSSLTVQAHAQDAQLMVDGNALTAPTNTLSSAVPGMSITLRQTGTSEIKVTRNASATVENVKDFVSAFNMLDSTLRAQQAGEGDHGAMIASIHQQIGAILDGTGAEALAEIGIIRDNGVLKLDESRLRQAVAADSGKVFRLFDSPQNGLGRRLASQVTLQMAKGGIVANEAAVVKSEVDKLTAAKTQITEAIGRQASMLVQQYAQAGAGGGTMFGLSGDIRPMSLFDILA